MQQINNPQSIIKLDKVCFSYNKEEVIKDISLEIKKGDYVGVVGPNGGGKTTLLKLILGLLNPKSDSIKLFDIDLKDFKNWSRIGYVSQRVFVETNFPITVEEIVTMGRYGKRGLFNLPTKEDKEKTLQALREVGMLEYKDRQINDLSGGQKQRVFIARALTTEPDVMLLDEPTAGVDIKTQKQFYKLLEKLNMELKLTLVLITHDLDVVMHEANKLAYINKTLEYFGDPHKYPKKEYIHKFIEKKEDNCC